MKAAADNFQAFAPVQFSHPGWLNRLLRLLCRCERAYLRLGPMPLGTSALAVVRNPANPRLRT